MLLNESTTNSPQEKKRKTSSQLRSGGFGWHTHPSPPCTLRGRKCGEGAGQSCSGAFLICNSHLHWQQCHCQLLVRESNLTPFCSYYFIFKAPQLQNSAVMKRYLGSPNALFMPQHHIHLANRWWLMNPRNF